MASEVAIQRALQQLIVEDAVAQLRRREGLMATLGSENGALKLDWVEAVARLLADPDSLEGVEADARAIRARGIRHIIWAGMGGSVLTVRVLCDLGFGGGRDADGDAITIHPLDSTDPAALNAIIRAIVTAKGLALPPEPGQIDSAFLRTLLCDVMMIGVAMGMTSEEPITHLTWVADLLEQAGLRPADHLLVMTLPGSYLDAFAREHQAPTCLLQLGGGTGTPGRMSAPGTRVFLLPAALYLTGVSAEPGQLRAALRAAWDAYNLDLATSCPSEHPFVRLAAALSAASSDGACRLLVGIPHGWGSFVSWLEQLMEESLGKGGKGIVVFDEQALNTAAPGYREDGALRVRVATEESAQRGDSFVLAQPALASREPRERLEALVVGFLGWQLTMALYGYRHRIQFAGQPAVENYKARARALREQPHLLSIATGWQPAAHDGMLTLLAPAGPVASEPDAAMSQPGHFFARALVEMSRQLPLGYLDVTINGEAQADVFNLLAQHAHTIGNVVVGVPVKLRQAPAAYHSTEQSEMDGPPSLVSLRLVAWESEACILGRYTNAFLHAQ
ncbi:MAG TPA: hypothetical protein VJR48_10410, partial [Ktedonobacterales bacterium]|nr:hypothetical protein [Ktedonobacterales bacterium]